MSEATALSAFFGSKLTFVSATAAPSDFGEDPRILPIEQEYPQAGLDQLVTGNGWPVCVETGPVGSVVRHVAQMEKADLVIINRGHMQMPFGKLETHVFEILVESPCPVLTLCMQSTALSIETAEEEFAVAAYGY